MTHATPRRPGNVAVVFALCLVTVTGMVALSLDGGMILDSRRHAQSAADAAAIAAADDLYLNWWTTNNQGTRDTLLKTGEKAARAAAKAMGYEDGVNGCTVEVYILPQTGLFVGVPGHAEVIITTSQDRTFSRIWSTDKVKYGARAVARGRNESIRWAILCLNPSGKASLNAGGNGSAVVVGAPIQVNSSDAEAMIANGNGSLTADNFYVYGDPGFSTPGGGSFVGPIQPNTPPIEDPLAGLPPPSTAGMPVTHKKITVSGNETMTLDPGVYENSIQVTGGTLTLNPGIYVLKGGISVSGQGNLLGVGVMLYNDPQSNSDVISLAGSGNQILLSPMLSGPYQGITLFQNRTATAPVSVSGSAGSLISMTGTFYTASATLNITGNGENQTLGSQYISYDLVLGGNGSYFCNWTAPLTPKMREILLVE